LAQGTLTLKGESALLMHNVGAMTPTGGGRKKIPLAEDEAAAAAYWMADKSSLCLYSYHIHAALIAASSGYRYSGRKSVIPVMSGCVRILPEELPLNTKEYVVDVRPVVVQRNRILRARARVFPWVVSCTVEYDEQMLNKDFMSTVFPEIVSHAGRAVGLLDFRPAKRGPFGRFSIQTWEL